MQCPCCSLNLYDLCCKNYLELGQFPDTPETLMRSRYTAYTQANTGYIHSTMRDKALEGFNPIQSAQWAKSVEWLGLNVLESTMSKNSGTVTFIARYRENNKNHFICEVSRFEKIDERWFYVSGKHFKIARNEACPCGSHKKYKHCCEKT